MLVRVRMEAPQGGQDRRSAARRKLRLTAGSEGAAVLIHDLSSTGLLIENSVELALGDVLNLDLPEAPGTRAAVVWCSGRFAGCEFEQPMSSGKISAALLKARFPQASPAYDDIDEFPPATKIQILFALTVGAWALIALSAWLVSAVVV